MFSVLKQRSPDMFRALKRGSPDTLHAVNDGSKDMLRVVKEESPDMLRNEIASTSQTIHYKSIGGRMRMFTRAALTSSCSCRLHQKHEHGGIPSIALQRPKQIWEPPNLLTNGHLQLLSCNSAAETESFLCV